RPQRYLRADTVLLDDYGGARTATEHLLAHGHRRIAVVSQSLDMHTMNERFRGYREAMADAGIEVDATLIRNDLKDAQDARGVVSAMFEGDDPPTAIFCANNRMSVGAIGALSENRSRVAVVGFDDLELADALAVPLTVVCADAAALGKAGAELLIKRMDGWSEPPQNVVLPTTLIERGSGEINPA
ncbi:MAG: substrate-binding domain-containing protein, partial [Chloroflexota bacterium]|nr:substrate-binding domain-containing protein [Chloroflexota bacterium]